MLGRKRIISACQQCKDRKRRCDGVEPSCGYCLKFGKDCIYTVRRRRGPGKSKEATKFSVWQQGQGDSSSELDAASADLSDRSPGHGRVNCDTVHNSGKDGMTSTSKSTNSSHQSPCSSSEAITTLSAAAKRFTAFSEDILMTTRQVQAQIQMNQSNSRKRVFTSLPPKHDASELMGPIVEEIQLHGIFLTKENALSQLAEYYSVGVNDFCDDPCRWATLWSFIGISALYRIADGSVAALSSIAWAFFKNAFAMYSDLAIRKPEISTCEALLAMALFMLRTADACVATRLTATTAQSVLMLGLHRYEHYINLGAEVAERWKRVFWVTYVVNAHVTHLYGLPSPFDAEDVDVEFPRHAHHDAPGHVDDMDGLLQSQDANLLRPRAILAVIQLRIDKSLQQALSRGIKRNSVTQETIAAINEELDVWNNSLPTSMQPGHQSYESPLLEMPIAMLHYIYFSCVCKVSMAMVWLSKLQTPNTDPWEQPLTDVDTRLSNSQQARSRCAIAARGILDVQFRLRPPPYTHLWQTLCFPLSAVLILLSEVLAHSRSVQAETDAKLIHDFVRYLERLQKGGSDVRGILDGCKRFHSFALCGLGASRSGEQMNSIQQSVELLRSWFTQVTDWLQLAQGLLSNMPTSHNTARDIFCEILNPLSTDDTYGAFVPECLKSSTYNLSPSN